VSHSLAETRVEGDRFSVRLVNDLASLGAGQRALHDFLAGAGLAERAIFQTELAFEELVTNVIRHAYAGRAAGSSPIDVLVRLAAAEVMLVVEDDGPPFDPAQVPDPPLPASIEDARVGGLGLRFIRAAAQRIVHERIGDKNRVTVWVARR
jgi:serine/threonine-protein kinase RsbW